MEHLTDRTSNPFGLVAPCDGAVYGFGDPNADFHLIGDHPGVHGGRDSGVPFAGTDAGERLMGVLHEVGLVAAPASDEPAVDDLFASYVCMCPPADGASPSAAEYARLERYFDAELRAVNAHVLLPVGSRATEHVLRTYTTMARKLDGTDLHAREVRGRGFLVVPVRDPAEWTDEDRRTLVDRLKAILSRDYRQTKGVATLVG